MARVIGRLSAVGIGKETTRGTAVAPGYWVGVTGFDFDDKVEYIDNDSSFGRIEELHDSAVSKRWGEGGYEGKIFINSVGLELYALFGQAPTSTQRATTGVYDHEFELLNTNEHGSVTLAVKDANQDVRYALAMLDEWELNADLDSFLTRSSSWFSKPSASASNTVSHTEQTEFLARHLQFYIDDTIADLDTATATPITNFTLTVSKNVEVQYVFGPDDIATNAAKIDNIINQQFGVEGSFEAYRDNLTARGYVLGGTKKALRLEAINTDVTIGTGGLHSPALRFDLAKVAFTEQERNWDANAATKQTISFKGLYDFTETGLLFARLTNTVTSY